VTPATASISTIQTQQFTAAVVNSANPAVTWKVDGVQGGNATVGVVSAGGLYTPPASEATHSITATSVADPTKSGSATITVKSIGVTVTPATASISTNQTQQFTAAVVNSANPAVTWKVDGIQGGNATVGVISAGGLYTPPASEATHSITATSVADPTKSGSATITVKSIGVTVTPATATISTIQTQQFTATVVNSANPAVTWKVDGVQGGNAAVGLISAGGLYTPPVTEATHTITATSVADPTKSGSASVTVKLIGVTVTPATASISTIQTQQFTATVVNSANPAVTWKVDGIQGGNATVGVISAGGLYTPPVTEATHTITATSVADPTRSGSASVTVKLIGVTVSPATASISTIQTQQFTATVVNSANPAVTWKVDGVQGGNATVGLISASGLYTPPLTEATHTITATSVADPTRSGSASVTVSIPSSEISVTVTPATASISTIQTQQFTATVANSQGVTWKVDGVQGGNATVGLISAGGLYTPPLSEATHSITATSVEDPAKSGSAGITVNYLSGVLTYHNDNARTGQYLQEALLTPANVGSATFGKLFSFPVDGAVYAQPLYVPNVPIAGELHNVVFVATEHNSVYAFDADNKTRAPLWQKSFIDPANGITTVPSIDTQCADISPEIGITGTPVIDPVTGTLYVVAMTKENGAYAHRIHALDITTGNSRFGTGMKIQASVPGTAANDGTGRVVFDSILENQRPGLLLNNDTLYVAVGSFCDVGDHHGWLLTYDSKTLDPLGAFNATPNGAEGGIWLSGGGPAADAGGSVYVVTGDGTFDAASDSFGDTVVKLTGTSLAVSDYFTPFNQADLGPPNNGDLGSVAPLLLPDQSVGPPHLMVAGGKQGIVYLLNRDDMGKFQPGGDSQIVQSFPGGACGPGTCAMFGTPAYFNNRVYTVAVRDSLKAYSLTGGHLFLSAQSTNTFRFPGATPAISANGSNAGIVWALETNGSGAPAVLRAYSAADVSIELYDSTQNSLRDDPGPAVKFTVPTIADGKVYVGAQGQLSVFGLLP
jgi:hypothetical protein